MKKKVYVASSWRNEHQQSLVKELRILGYEVYDFKHPNGDPGFQWSKIDEKWQKWSMEQYREAMKDEYAKFGFIRDFDAMKEAENENTVDNQLRIALHCDWNNRVFYCEEFL